MIFWLITFIVSGITLIAFIGIKLLQQKYQILLFWPGSRDALERVLQRRQARLESYMERIRQRGLLHVVYVILTLPRAFLRGIRKWFLKRSDRVVRVVQGKQEIENRGKASYFLNDITSARDEFRR